MESVFSPSWRRVAHLKPRIRSHAHIHRHSYRGELWYVLQDKSTGKFHRFTPTAYQIIGLLDGKRTLQDVWEEACVKLENDAPTQDEMLQLLSQLHSIDILHSDVLPDNREIFERRKKGETQKFKQKLRSPLALRFPLFDPDKMLSICVPYAGHLFSAVGAVIWVLVVAAGAILAANHWQELTQDVADRVLAPHNLLLIWFIYPIIKAFHELGHGLAAKKWGGEVHEMGIMLLVFFPVPYVDASSASGFRDRWRRIIVGAAGILVELFIASLALFVWLNVEPGMVSAVAYNVMLIGGVSTLLFNGNPLLRYDGYYILTDILEIPNLAIRSQQYLGYLIQRYLFGVENAKTPVSAKGERFWFITYSIASFVYRMMVVIGIILFIAGKYFFVGVVLALWASISIFVIPLAHKLSFVISNHKIRQKRARAILTSASIAAAVVGLLFLYPAPNWTRAEGVIWLPDQSIVRAGADGFVRKILEESGKRVMAGAPLVLCDAPILVAEKKVLEARLAELQIQKQIQLIDDRVQAEVINEQILATMQELEGVKKDLDSLVLKSRYEGVFVLPNSGDLEGAYVKKGQIMGYIFADSNVTVRTVIPQSRVGLVRGNTLNVELRFIDNLDKTIGAYISREVPEASTKLPSPALGTVGGGETAIDPSNAYGDSSYQEVFQLELGLLEEVDMNRFGHRVIVRFDHGTEAIAFQIYRRIRQLFLKRFNV